jgi:hypothetical protein
VKANYGYMDGSGNFFITIDTDYDDEVAAIKEEHRKKVKYDCGPCKPITDRPPLPCVAACTPGAISHSW